MRTNGSADGLLLLVVAILLVSAVTSSWAHGRGEYAHGAFYMKGQHERFHARVERQQWRKAAYRAVERSQYERCVAHGVAGLHVPEAWGEAWKARAEAIVREGCAQG